MIYVLSGTHSVGKTTLLNAMKDDNYYNGYTFIDSPLREVSNKLKSGLYDKTGVETQLVAFNRCLENLLSYDNVIFDRSINDVLAYTYYGIKHGQLPGWLYNYSINVISRYIDRIDKIFYIPPEFPIVNDGVRLMDESYRDEIHSNYNMIHNTYCKDNQLCLVTGSVEDRLVVLKQNIEGI